MWIKLLLCVLIVAFCTFLGYFAAGKYRSRRKFYQQFVAFNERFLHELEYARRPLQELIQNGDLSGDFARMLEFHAARKEFELNFSYLTKEERTECKEYLSMLGTGDAHSQRSYFASQMRSLAEKQQASEKDAKERGELYLKLGVLAGLAFVILVI